jgi:protein O-mannosyl-transferase
LHPFFSSFFLNVNDPSMVKITTKEEPGSTLKVNQSAWNTLNDRDPHLLRKGYPLLWFAIIAFLLFGQTISFSYTYLDDQTLVLGKMQNLKSASYLTSAFTGDVFNSPPGHGFYYRPILTISFMADAMIGQGKFGLFHFFNILYHILATFLLFQFFTKMVNDRMKSFLFAILFLVHPLITQAVAWVPGRNDTLLAIFVLASFLSWLKFLKSGSSRDMVLHLLFYLLALFTKENAIALPFLIAFYSSVLMRTPLKKYFISGIAWVLITFLWAVMRNHALGGAGEMPFSAQALSVLANLPAVLPFLGKALFPFGLSVYPVLADMTFPAIMGIVGTGVLLVLVLVSKPKRWFYYFFGLTWFLAFLVPSFVTFNSMVPKFSEHRSYLSLAGILLFIMVCNPVNKTNFAKLIPLLSMVCLILLFSVLTFLHSRDFKDQFAFWQNAVDTSPSHAFNYNNLGAMYFLDGNLEKAEPLFRKALAVNPYEPMANSNTGLVCMQTGRPAEAEKYYLEEIRINPSYDHAYYNLGLLYFNNSRQEEGIQLWEKTLTVNPGYVDAYKALLFAYEKMERQDDYNRIVAKARENGMLNQ